MGALVGWFDSKKLCPSFATQCTSMVGLSNSKLTTTLTMPTFLRVMALKTASFHYVQRGSLRQSAKIAAIESLRVTSAFFDMHQNCHVAILCSATMKAAAHGPESSFWIFGEYAWNLRSSTLTVESTIYEQTILTVTLAASHKNKPWQNMFQAINWAVLISGSWPEQCWGYQHRH